MPKTGKLEVSYVLPLRWHDDQDQAALTSYLRELSNVCVEVIVVDGSPLDLFEANDRAWGSLCAHIPPDPDTACKMGKVAGIHTGIRHAHHEHVVLADDDVRYDPQALARTSELLEIHDLVRPQNFFQPLPWHARWDTARTLLNRGLGGDYPGTLAVRRSPMVAMGGYDGDVMFENLELIRTVEAHGGSALIALDLYVLRIPPTATHFWSQRTRQAYDDFAIPLRMVCWLAILPALVDVLRRRRVLRLLQGATGSILLAEYGRRRSGGRQVFPATSSLLAPLWILERGICSWLAVAERVRFGGVRYRDAVIPTAAHSKRYLRKRLAPASRRTPRPDR
jgi:hypothetical protein